MSQGKGIFLYMLSGSMFFNKPLTVFFITSVATVESLLLSILQLINNKSLNSLPLCLISHILLAICRLPITHSPMITVCSPSRVSLTLSCTTPMVNASSSATRSLIMTRLLLPSIFQLMADLLLALRIEMLSCGNLSSTVRGNPPLCY